MPTKYNTNSAPSATQLAQAQQHGSQLLRAAHDAAVAIDRAWQLEDAKEPTEGHRASARIARMQAFGAAQDAKLLASRMMGALAGADEGAAMVLDASNAASDAGLAALTAVLRAEFCRDVAAHVVAALTAGEVKPATAPRRTLVCATCGGQFGPANFRYNGADHCSVDCRRVAEGGVR